MRTSRITSVWKSVPAAVRKPLVFIVGSSIILGGLALLVLPGPGWVAIFLGFAILATEFAFAEKVRDWLVNLLKLMIAKIQQTFKKGRSR